MGYTNGLIRFIESSATPITIGVQGEWGSGKTSLLNTIKYELCEKDGANYYGVWLNTWEYSLMSTSDEVLIKIISGLILEIGKITKKSRNWKKNIKTVATALENLGEGIGGLSGGIAKMTAGLLETASDKQQTNSIRILREALQTVINEAIEESEGKKEAFIFFIDDLDRLDPAVAVQILELIKNLFELDKCIFVLAIDYGVVVKGLQSKFGVMTEENEWEFRAFFDKIIQLPFSMPTSNYDVSEYLKSHLIGVNYFKEEDLNNKDALKNIIDIVSWSVGTNPRSLIRLANSVGLIENIRDENDLEFSERIIEFALVCIQVAYPLIYGFIQKEPDFASWDEQFTLENLKNKLPDDTDLENIKDKNEFDDEWEQNLWRLCQINNFLKQNVFQISKLLNLINENLPSDTEDKKKVLNRLLSTSSITSVSADSAEINAKRRTPRAKQKFAKFMDALIEDELSGRYASDIVQKFKITSKKNSGSLLIPVKKDKLDFDLCIDTDYKAIRVFVDNRVAKEKARKNTIRWFEENMKNEFPHMKFRDKSRVKDRVVTLMTIKVEDLESRDDILDKYAEVIKETLDKFMSKQIL